MNGPVAQHRECRIQIPGGLEHRKDDGDDGVQLTLVMWCHGTPPDFRHCFLFFRFQRVASKAGAGIRKYPRFWLLQYMQERCGVQILAGPAKRHDFRCLRGGRYGKIVQ